MLPQPRRILGFPEPALVNDCEQSQETKVSTFTRSLPALTDPIAGSFHLAPPGARLLSRIATSAPTPRWPSECGGLVVAVHLYLFPVRGAPDLRTHAYSSRARSEFHKNQPFTVELPTPHPCCLLPQPLAPFLPPGPDSRIPHSSLVLIQPPFDPRPNCHGGSIRQKAR